MFYRNGVIRWTVITGVFSLVVAAFSASAKELDFREIRQTQASAKRLFCVAVDSSERLIATGGSDFQLNVWNAVTGNQLRQWTPSEGLVIDCDFSPSGPFIAAVSFPNLVSLYDAKGDKQVWQIEFPTRPIRVTFSDDGNRIAVASSHGKAAIYDAKDGRLVASMSHELPVSHGVAFLKDSHDLLVGTNARRPASTLSQVVVCDGATGAVKEVVAEHRGERLTRLRISPSGRNVAFSSLDGIVEMWQLDGRKLLDRWSLNLNAAAELRFLDDETVAVASETEVTLLRVENSQPIKTIRQPDPGTGFLAQFRRRGVLAIAKLQNLQLLAYDKTQFPLVAPPNVATATETSTSAAEEPTKEAPTGMTKKPDVPAKYNTTFRSTDNVPPIAGFDGLVQNGSLSGLIGKPLSLQLKSGIAVHGAVLTELQFDRRNRGLMFVKYMTETGRKASTKVSDIYAARIGGVKFHLRYFPPAKQFILIDSQQARATAENRLAALGAAFQNFPTEPEHREANESYKKFLEDASKTLAGVGRFNIQESDRVLLLTDYPPHATVGIRRYLDQLNLTLSRVFGIPTNQSVWKGKTIIAAFSTPAGLARFEEDVMNYPNHAGKGQVRSKTDRYVQSIRVPEFNAHITYSLCWGYSLGFGYRIHSNLKTNPWLTSGIADHVPNVIIADRSRIERDRKEVIKSLREDQSLLGILDATSIEKDRRPLCSELVAFMIKTDPISFNQLFRDVKLGIDLETALQQNYGVSKQQFAKRFGESCGVPGVKP